MSFMSFLQGLILAFVGFWWPKGETVQESPLETAPKAQDNMDDRLNYIEAKLHSIGHRLNEVEETQRVINEKLDAQIILSEEILASLALLEPKMADQTIVNNGSKIRVVAEVQQKSKKQILN